MTAQTLLKIGSALLLVTATACTTAVAQTTAPAAASAPSSADSASSSDGDLAPVPASEAGYGTAPATPVQPQSAPPAQSQPATQAQATTYDQADVITAAEDVFGRGAEGAAKIIERVFQDLGRPNAYIVGREASGAFVAGLRYGNGTLHHKVEGQMPVHWTGPSIGADIGGDASKTFTLIYNLHDSEELFRRFPAVEGKVYVIGGFTANYHQRDNVVLVPIKLGVGWRLGANIGYLSYSKKGKILPF